MVNNPSNKVKTESIDEVILRLLGLKPGVEIDYQTYYDILKKKLALVRLTGKELPAEEDELLREEFKRVRVLRDKKLRFKIKEGKTKVSSNTVSSEQKKIVGVGQIIKYKKPEIIPKTFGPQTEDNVEVKKDNFAEIKKTLESILNTLSSRYKFEQKQSSKERIEKEKEKRSKRESLLEGLKKGISGVVSLTKKMLSPFDNILQRIWRFIFFTLLGRAFTKFMNWLDDKKNQEKFNSFIEFLSDHWPALAGLYILFGTSFGKLVRGLLKGVTRMIVAIGVNLPKIFGFLRKNKKIAFLSLAAAPLVTREISNLFSNKETPESGLIPKTNPELEQAKQSVGQVENAKVDKFNIGGLIPKFNLGGILPSFNKGSVNPYGGMDFSGGIPITGAGKDDTLIAAKTGEAILTEKDQVDLGQRYVDRTTGQPLNIPQYLAGRKPGSVPMSNLRFPGFGGGFFNGGMIPKFNIGGMVGGGIINKFNVGGMVGGNPKIEDIMREAHSTTVRIERGEEFGGGSGVLVRNDNGTYSVLTAGHVISGYVPGEEGNTIKIVTPDGKKHDIDPKSVRQSGVDLGSVKFRSEENYMTARSGDPLKMKKGDSTFVGGYPLDPKTGLQDKVLRFSTGQIVDPNSTDDDALKGGQTLRYSNQTQAGMSGGFVFNSQGELIGIHGQSSAKGFIAGSGAVPISSSIGTFGSTDTRNPYVNPNLHYLQLSKLQQDKADQTYRNIRGVEKDYGGPRGDQYLVGEKPDINVRVKKGFMSGGLIKENTGVNISGTADRQLIAVQPGEGVLTKNIMYTLFGGSEEKFNKFSAFFDSHSGGARFEKSNINKPKITPYKTYGSSGMDGMITLPPIMQSAGSTGARASGHSGGSDVPSFSIIASVNDRSTIASIYGIEGVG